MHLAYYFISHLVKTLTCPQLLVMEDEECARERDGLLNKKYPLS